MLRGKGPGMSGNGAIATVTIPRGVMLLFTVLQPIIASAICGSFALMFSMNSQITILNVKMEQALETKGELKAIDERFNLLSERVTRIESRQDESP